MSEKDLDLIVKSNKLVEASYKLTQAEFNLLNLVFAQMNDGKIGETGNWLLGDYKVTAQDYSRKFDVDINTAYDALHSASKHLFQRYFSYEKEVDFSPYAVEIVESRWVSEVRYNKQAGYVTIVLTPTVMDMVGMLQNCFTPYFLQNTVGFSSMYAKRLYEILVQWRNAGNKTPQLKVYALREKLGIDKDQYPLIADFKKRVLDIAVEQINEHSDIKVKYDQIKQGRKIVAFCFKFKDKQVKSKAERDPQTIDAFNGLTDLEQKAITARADSHIQKNNITDPTYKANIRNKAIAEKWGVVDQPPAPPVQAVEMPDLGTVEEDLKSKMLTGFLNKQG